MQNQSISPSSSRSPLIAIFFMVFLYLVGFGVIIPILPIWARSFGATPFQVGALMTVYSLMQFIFAPFWGRMSDRKGRRPILLFCLLGEALSYVILAMSKSLEMLFVARILAGFFGASISTASAYVSDVTTADKRSQGMALIGAAFGLGFLIGPALGGGLTLLGQNFSADPLFGPSFASLFVAVLCLLNFVYSLKVLKESLPPDIAKRVLAEKRHRFQILGQYLQQPILGKVMLLYGISSVSMALMEASLIIYVGDRFQWTIKEVSFGFAYIGLIMVLAQGFLTRKLLKVIGEKKMLAIGFTLMTIALASIPFMPTVFWLAGSMTLLAIGNSLTNPSVMGSVSLLAEPHKQGEVLGVTQSLASLGRIIGPVSGGWLYQAVKGSAPFVTGGVLSFLGLLIVFTEYKKLPNSAQVIK